MEADKPPFTFFIQPTILAISGSRIKSIVRANNDDTGFPEYFNVETQFGIVLLNERIRFFISDPIQAQLIHGQPDQTLSLPRIMSVLLYLPKTVNSDSNLQDLDPRQHRELWDMLLKWCRPALDGFGRRPLNSGKELSEWLWLRLFCDIYGQDNLLYDDHSHWKTVMLIMDRDEYIWLLVRSHTTKDLAWAMVGHDGNPVGSSLKWQEPRRYNTPRVETMGPNVKRETKVEKSGETR